MKIKRKIITIMIMVICLCSSVVVAYAETKNFNVTVSGVPSNVSPDPWTYMASKNDNESLFYITVTSLTGSSNIKFNAYDSNYKCVSDTATYYSSYVGSTRSYKYNKYVYAGNKYALKAFVSNYTYTMINAVGRFTP